VPERSPAQALLPLPSLGFQVISRFKRSKATAVRQWKGCSQAGGGPSLLASPHSAPWSRLSAFQPLKWRLFDE